MSDETTLIPCPFCGGEAELKEYKPNVSGVAICKECGARSPICKNDHTGGWRPKAIEAWNQRHEETCEYKPMWNDDDLITGEYVGMWWTGCGDAIVWNGDNDKCGEPPFACPYCGGIVKVVD